MLFNDCPYFLENLHFTKRHVICHTVVNNDHFSTVYSTPTLLPTLSFVSTNFAENIQLTLEEFILHRQIEEQENTTLKQTPLHFLHVCEDVDDTFPAFV